MASADRVGARIDIEDNVSLVDVAKRAYANAGQPYYGQSSFDSFLQQNPHYKEIYDTQGEAAALAEMKKEAANDHSIFG